MIASTVYSFTKFGVTAFAVATLTACSSIPGFDMSSLTSGLSAPQQSASTAQSDTSGMRTFTGSEKDCLMRAMYFESNRSSEDGMLAVGTVVMNRVDSSRFPNSICSVVGAPRQFAPGVLSRTMAEVNPKALASKVADRVMSGARHRGVKTAKFFHTAGLRFPYNNMNYVLEAGGNEFYIKG